MALARGQPESSEDLGQDYNLSAKFRDRHGDRLLAAIARGRRQAADHPRLTGTPLTRAERQELKALAEAVKQRATGLGLAPEILATRQEITDLMRGGAPARLVSGWRAEQLRDLTR